MEQKTKTERRAYSLAEIADMLGHHRSWVYRQVKDGKIKTIVGFGNQMVTSDELDRILSLSKTQTIKS